ncbi:MAG: hypothetical protein D6803_08410 [Anaerolineae bacterium]|nr:MAG: hypothetical protein D6803_08410 [Anaerolineae bacterium]
MGNHGGTEFTEFSRWFTESIGDVQHKRFGTAQHKRFGTAQHKRRVAALQKTSEGLPAYPPPKRHFNTAQHKRFTWLSVNSAPEDPTSAALRLETRLPLDTLPRVWILR